MKLTSQKLLTGKPNASWVQNHSYTVLDLLKVRMYSSTEKICETLWCEDCCLLVHNVLKFTQLLGVTSEKTAVFLVTTVTTLDVCSSLDFTIRLIHGIIQDLIMLMVNIVLDTVNQGGLRGLLSSQYRLIASDLHTLKKLESNLVQAGATFSLPTLFLAECAICYMEEARYGEW